MFEIVDVSLAKVSLVCDLSKLTATSPQLDLVDLSPEVLRGVTCYIVTTICKTNKSVNTSIILTGTSQEPPYKLISLKLEEYGYAPHSLLPF